MAIVQKEYYEFKPDYICDNSKCNQVKRDIVEEYQNIIKGLTDQLETANEKCRQYEGLILVNSKIWQY